MREILFRAKRRDNGEWVEGYYIPIEENAYIVVEASTECMDAENTDFYAVEWYQVDPETVCQFTGLTDKNGVKIFEGDVVETRDYRKHKICIGECCPNVWKNWCEDHLVKKEMPIIAVYAKTLEFGNEVFVPIDNVCEVIGNIFDNPELMEGGEADETD